MGNSKFYCLIKAHFPMIALFYLPWLRVLQTSLLGRGVHSQGCSIHDYVQDLGSRDEAELLLGSSGGGG